MRIALSCTLLSTVAAILVSGCDKASNSASAPRGPIYSLRIIHSADTYQFVKDVADKFNASNQRLADGTTVQLSSAVFDDVGHLERITSGEMQAQLWLASSSLLSSMSRTRDANHRAKLVDCQSVMRSPLGIAYRPEDAFLTQQGEGSLLHQAALSRPAGAPTIPSLLLGSPRYHGLGILSALAVSAGVQKTSIQSLTESSTLSAEARERAGSAIRSFFTSDAEALSFLSRRSGGAPLFAITTQQAAKLFKLYNPSTQLGWKPLEDKAAVADYPLCTIETRNAQGAEGQAIRLTRAFFSSQATTDSLTSLGYEKPSPAEDVNFTKLAPLGSKVVDVGSQALRPSVTTFVIDTSIRMDRQAIETIRREIKAFADMSPTGNLVALVPASTNPSISTPPSTKGEDLERAITRLTTSGGNAIRTGLNTAFDLYSDTSLQKYRRAIVVLTTSDEPLVQDAFSSLINRGDQFVGRRNVDLYVIGIGGSPQEFSSLNQFTQFIGGTFKLTNTANLPATLLPLLRQLQ